MKVTGPSGTQYEWTRPPRYVHWRHGRIAQTFHSRVEELSRAQSEGPSEDLNAARGLALLESLSASEAERLEAYVTDVVAAGLKRKDVDDVPDADLWHLFALAVYAVGKAPVETTEGETTAKAVETFPQESGVPADGADVPDVPGESVAAHGHP